MRRWSVRAAAGVVAMASLSAFGIAWTNEGTGSWDTPSNWEGNVVPTSGCLTNDVGGTIVVSDGVTAHVRPVDEGHVCLRQRHADADQVACARDGSSTGNTRQEKET